MVTIVLVHGAGDTAAVWNEVQRDLPGPSLALDLPGRGGNPSDLSRVSVGLAVRRAVADIVELTSGPVVLVAHSIGGAVSPGILALLGERVAHLVHIAAVAAAEGEPPLAVASASSSTTSSPMRTRSERRYAASPWAMVPHRCPQGSGRPTTAAPWPGSTH